MKKCRQKAFDKMKRTVAHKGPSIFSYIMLDRTMFKKKKFCFLVIGYVLFENNKKILKKMEVKIKMIQDEPVTIQCILSYLYLHRWYKRTICCCNLLTIKKMLFSAQRAQQQTLL